MLRFGNIVPDSTINFKRNMSKVIQASDLGFTRNLVPVLLNNKESNSVKEATETHIPITENVSRKTEKSTIKIMPVTTTTTTTVTPTTTRATIATTTTTTTTTTTPVTITTTTTTTTTTTPSTTTIPPSK